MLKLRCFLKLIFHDLAWELRLILAALVLPARHRDILKALRSNGAVVVPGYYSEDEMQVIEASCNQALDEAVDMPITKGKLIRMEGSIRLQHLDKRKPLLRRFARDAYLVFLNFIFEGKLSWPSVMYGVTHDGTYEHPAVPGKASARFGGHYHVDQWRHQLKGLTPLDDVVLENGPLAYIPGTSGIHWKRFDNYLAKFREAFVGKGAADGAALTYNSNPLDKEYFDELVKRKGVQYATCKRGDLVLFDTRNLHYATELTAGRRRIVWMYF